MIGSKMLKILREYDAAVEKHPEFPTGQAAVSIIAEELGELARELNDDFDCVPGAHERAITEAAHVAVTAIRTMEMLSGEKSVVTNGDKIRQMNDEELAEFLGLNSLCPTCPANKICHSDKCRDAYRDWLKQEAR